MKVIESANIGKKPRIMEVDSRWLVSRTGDIVFAALNEIVLTPAMFDALLAEIDRAPQATKPRAVASQPI